MIFDAHTHLYQGKLPCQNDFYQLASASTPEECRTLDTLRARNPQLYYSCGIHPWQSEAVPASALMPWLPNACAIGEIGMDSVWCSVDLAVQRQAFQSQLSLAAKLQKPVILHTKGCEHDVLEHIQAFPFPILVHWYSCNEHVEDYIKKGCYFTIGPDLRRNPAVQRLAALTPLNRLLVESDGVEGVSWALGRKVSLTETSNVLRGLIADLARLRDLPPKAMAETLFRNALAFLNVTPPAHPAPVRIMASTLSNKKQIP